MDEAASVPEEFHIIRLLHETRHATYRVLVKEFKQLGVTPIQVVVLDVIRNSSKPVTSAEISRQIARAHPTIAALIRRMEKKELVKLSRDMNNKNWIRVVLKKRGRQVHSEALKKEGIMELFSCLAKGERQQLQSCLEILQARALAILKDNNQA